MMILCGSVRPNRETGAPHVLNRAHRPLKRRAPEARGELKGIWGWSAHIPKTPGQAPGYPRGFSPKDRPETRL
jgi:hypothetical protein